MRINGLQDYYDNLDPSDFEMGCDCNKCDKKEKEKRDMVEFLQELADQIRGVKSVDKEVLVNCLCELEGYFNIK